MMTMPFASRRTAPLIAALGLLALAACSNPEKTARYLIDPPATGDMVANRLGTAELKDVSLPEYASGQEVSWQTPDGAVRSTPDDLWADSPQRAFTLSLARAISDVSGATVIGEPWPLAQPPPPCAWFDESHTVLIKYFLTSTFHASFIDSFGWGTHFVHP